MNNRAILFAALITGLFLMPGLASAQGQTSSGTLTVTAEVQSSISLTFITDPNGVALQARGLTLPHWISAMSPNSLVHLQR